MKTEIPQAIDYAEKLIADNPKYFVGQPMTPFVIAQYMIDFAKDVSNAMFENQEASVFNNHLQDGLTKFQLQNG